MLHTVPSATGVRCYFICSRECSPTMYTTYFTHDTCSWSGLLVIYSTLFECNVGLETGILVASSELCGCSTSVVTLVRMLVVSSVRLSSMKTIYEFLFQGSCPVDVLQCSIHESGSVTTVLFCLFRFLLGGTRSLASSEVILRFAVARRTINEFIDKEARVTLVREERLVSRTFLARPSGVEEGR